MRTQLKNRIKISGIFLILLVIFFHKIIFTGQTYFVRDTLIQEFPWKTFAAEQIKSGKIPLWNPYTYSGMPFLANMQSAVFYPPNILFYFLPFVSAYKLYILFHFFLAGFFMYLLMKDFRVNEDAAFVSGFIFAFNGYLLTRIEFLSVLGASVWLPATFLLLRRCLKAGDNIKNVILLGIVFAVQFFAGHPQVLLYGIFLLLFYAVVNDIRRGRIKALTALAVSGLIAVLISAVQLIPSLEFFLHSTRAGGLDYGIVSENSLSLKHLLNFFNPFLKYHHNFWTFACYVGILPVLFSLLSFFRGRKIVLFFGAIFLLTIFFAAGKFNPFLKVFYNFVPLFRLFRHPAVILYLSVFSLSVLAGFGLDRFRFSPRPFFPRPETLAGKERGSRTAQTIIAVLIICDLFIVGRKFNTTVDGKIFTVYGDKIAFLRGSNGFHRFFLTPKTDGSRKVQGFNFFDTWSNWKDNLYGNTNMCFHLFNAVGDDPMKIKRYMNFLDCAYMQGSVDDAGKLLSILNVKYVLSVDKVKSQKYKPVMEGPVKIYENRNFLPRTFFVRSAVFKKKEEVLNYLTADSFDPEEKIVLEGEPEEHPKEQSRPCAQERGKNGSAEIVHYEPGEVVVRVVAPEAGWVVLSDTYFPGWKAYVDGRKAEIFRANYIFRAVAVNSGSHAIEFIYKPISYKIGEIVTIISLLSVLFAVFKLF